MDDDRLLVGLDVGGTKVLATAIEMRDGKPVVVAEHQVATPSSREGLLDVLVAGAQNVAGDREMATVGVGLPGYIDLANVLRKAPHLTNAVGVAIVAELEARLGCPVRVDNDANCAGWAAFKVDAPDAKVLAAVTLGTGIGGGFVIDGSVWRGAHGFAGELGHMIVDATGPPCACGQHGCWEVWASGAGLGRLARRMADEGSAPDLVAGAGSLESIESPMVTAAAAKGSGEALAILDRYGWWVAVGLMNLINIVDPDTIVLGGGIVANGDLVLAPIRRHLDAFVPLAPVDLRISSLGPRAGAIGAALLGT